VKATSGRFKSELFSRLTAFLGLHEILHAKFASCSMQKNWVKIKVDGVAALAAEK